MDRVLTKLRKAQQAGYLLAAFSVLLVLVGAVLANFLLGAASERAQREGTSQLKQLTFIEQAIAAYVAVNKRLPCPADGSLPSGHADEGVELRDPVNGDANDGICYSALSSIDNQKTGIVPWRTLGLNELQVFSEDRTHYTYRVFSGPKGFTLDNGADMSACDTDNGLTPNAILPANGQCTGVNETANHTVAQFIADKGLSVVTDAGSITAAYVLIHHGANGRGAFQSGGTRSQLPLSTATKEYANTQGTDGATFTYTYYATTPSTSVPSNSDDYFDDRVVAPTIIDVAKKAGLYARNWPETGDILNADTLQEAGFDLASIEQSFGTKTIGAATYTASGGQMITINSTAAPSGIGVGTAANPEIEGTDTLTIEYSSSIEKFSIILSSLGKKTSGGSSGKFEGATLELKDPTDDLVATVALTSCLTTTDVTTNVIAFDNVTAGVSFRKIILKPGIASDPTVAAAADTNFYLNGIAPCSSASSSCLPAGASYSQSCSFTFTTP